MKNVFIILLSLTIVAGKAQEVKKGTMPYPSFEGTPHRCHVDSSRWILYKIDSGNYSYYKIISYELTWPSGWSDAVAYFDRKYLITKGLLPPCKITDTIPAPMYISGYDDEKKMFKSWTEYRVGGIFGELIRIGEIIWTKK